MNALQKQLIDRINRDGPITFRDFMDSALYDPNHGYYTSPRPKIGRTGDYYTSSNVHRAFGEVLAKAINEMWAGAGRSTSPLTVVEIGAGTGQLADDILESLDGRCHLSKYVIVERSEAMRAVQKEKLERWLDRVEWIQFQDLAQVQGIVCSNELFDSLPVHRVRRGSHRWEEQYVTLAGNEAGRDATDSLTVSWDRLSQPELSEYLLCYGDLIGPEQVVEVNLAALNILAEIARFLKTGFVITIDYGETADGLYLAARRDGTLRSFYRHRLTTTLLDRPGEQDITASVNFTALIDRGRRLGLEPVSLERQTQFLVRMGLVDIAARAASDEQGSDLAGRLALKSLFVPGGISDSFRVLIQRRI